MFDLPPEWKSQTGKSSNDSRASNLHGSIIRSDIMMQVDEDSQIWESLFPDERMLAEDESSTYLYKKSGGNEAESSERHFGVV